MTGITMASLAQTQFQLVALTLVDEFLTARGCVIDGVAGEGWYADVVIMPAARGSSRQAAQWAGKRYSGTRVRPTVVHAQEKAVDVAWPQTVGVDELPRM